VHENEDAERWGCESQAVPFPHTSRRQCKLRAPLDFDEEAYGAGQKEDC
jgi:hypothetical protein